MRIHASLLLVSIAMSGCGKVDTSSPDAQVGDDVDAAAPVQLTVTVTGPGSVSVSPNGTSCGADCYELGAGTHVTLTPAPDPGAAVSSWSGPCASTAPGSPCAFDLAADPVSVDVQFACVGPPCSGGFSTTSFDLTGAAQTFTVPAGATSLHIVADGASGGEVVNPAGAVFGGGHGAHVDTTVPVTAGHILTIIVGEQPGQNVAGNDGCGASGGGASLVADGSTVLAVAGGGGGGSSYSTYSIAGGDAQIDTSGASSNTIIGGTGGNGGSGATGEGGGGGGVLSPGGDGINGGTAIGGQGLLAGAGGGARAQTEACGAIAGGFGGGGGGGDDCGGGGGGYSGGAAQESGPVGFSSGGGGSYSAATATITVRTVHGHGHIDVTPL